ncbi:MAG: hypothetical protein JRC89_05810 [Deltaproteobacteria bacterium]|nr:hypothetical protein [Deltaproteobacteria bacterium]
MNQNRISKPNAISSLEISVIDSVAKDSLRNLVETAAELTLDNILENDDLKQIPVFGTLLNMVKLGSNIRDRLFARKLLTFLREISTISFEKRKRFVDKLSSNKQKTGEAILLLLERLDDMTKPEIVGKITCLAILGDIDTETSFKLSAMVDRSYISDLWSLPKTETMGGLDLGVAEALASVGLLDRKIETDILGLSGKKNTQITTYSLNKYGKILAEIVNNVKP